MQVEGIGAQTEDVPPTSGDRNHRPGGRGGRVGKSWLEPETALVLVLLVIAFAVRLWGLHTQSFTADELGDLRAARTDGDFGDLLKGAKRFPPLYHLMLRGWLEVFGSDEAARLLSVLIGLLAVVAVWRLARRVAGEAAGLWAAGIVAIAPFFVWYSQEARVYGLYLLLAALTLLFFVRAWQSDTVLDWALYVLFAAAGLFTHYYFITVIGVTALMQIVNRRRWGQLRRAVRAYGLLALIGIPWLLLLLRDLEGEWGASADTEFGWEGFGYTLFSFVSGYTLGPSLRELHTLSTVDAVSSALPWIAAVAIVAGLIGVVGLAALRGSPWSTILVVGALAPVAVVGLLSAVGPFGFNMRHIVWSSVVFVVIAAAGLARLNKPAAAAAAAALIVIFGFAIQNRVLSDRYRNEDAASVASYLEISDPASPVFVSVRYLAGPIGYYAENVASVRAVEAVSPDGSGLTEALEMISGDGADRVYWLAYSRPFHGDPSGLLLESLKQRDGLELVEQFAGIDLYRGHTAR